MLRCCFAKNLFIVFLPLLCSAATQQEHKRGWVQLEKCGIVGKWREDSEYLDYLWNWRPQCSHSWVKQDQDIQFLNSYINLIICTFIVWYGASGIEMELISDYIPRVGSWERILRRASGGFIFNRFAVASSASNEGYPNVPEDFTITEKAPTRAFSWLKADTIKTLC